MNDLTTKSFLNYVDLKKQAMEGLEAVPDIEMGKLNLENENNLSQFFQEVTLIKSDMEEISNLLFDLQLLNEDTKSVQSTKVLGGIRDRINSNMVSVLRKAKIIKMILELLDQSNFLNMSLSVVYREGSPVDRTRMSVTNGLRIKLRDMMNEFQSLREKIAEEHKEGLKRRYYNATGEKPSEEMISGGGKIEVFEGKTDLVATENREREEGLKEIKRNLIELHQVFLDMAMLVETQGEKIDTIPKIWEYFKISPDIWYYCK